MTREEEIKDKLETYQAKYMHWQSGRQLDSAEDDIGYLLARNEELQRRVRLLEDVLGRCETLADNGADDPAGPYNVLQQVVNTICAVLYAKEQDDD